MISLPVILDNCVPKKDRSATLRFTTALELSPEQNARFFDMLGSAGLLYFRVTDDQRLSTKELEALDSIDLDLSDPKKSQSKRLRDVLYVWQSQILGRKPTKDEQREFYFTQTEKIINSIKDKLE